MATERQNLVDAIEALDEGFAAYDSDGRLLQCNQKFLDYYPTLKDLTKPGVTYEALLRRKAETGAEPAAVGHEEEFVTERLADIYVTNTVRECELSDGRVLQRSSYRTSCGGHMAVYANITEIKRAESGLRELNRDLDARVQERTEDLNKANEQLELLNAELGAIIISAPVGVVVLGPERKATTWNPAAIKLTGRYNGEVTTGLSNIVPGDARADVQDFLDQVYRSSGSINTELSLRHRDGNRIEANVSGSVLSDDQGHPIGAIIIIADLTEARDLQNQFQQSQKMEVVAKLSAGLAHEFNNLLAIVISNIELAENRVKGDDPVQDLLQSAKRASVSGVALNKILLAFSCDKSLELEGLDLGKEISFLGPLLQVTLGEGISLDINLPPDLWPVIADRSLLRSAILNMAVNASDAMGGEGQFDISARSVTLEVGEDFNRLTGEFVRITMADTGDGLSEEVISRAFQPFFTTKDFGKGSGLGLSMVYGFVKQSGGDIRIESEEGIGTQITIMLPRAELISGKDTDFPLGLAKIKGDGENILVVEDNAQMRRALVLQLAELGVHPIQADGGLTALDLLEAEVPIDVMLTDIVMPGGMDGRELAHHARAFKAELPIVFISGYPADDEDDTRSSWESLGIKVLAKSVTQNELGAQINEALRQGAT